MILLAPKTNVVRTDPNTGKKIKELESVIERYHRISKLFEGDGSKIKEYRAKLFGQNVVDVSTARYNILSTLKDLGIPYSQWEEWDIHDRAMFLAQRYLQNMIDIIHRHMDIQAEVKKKYNM